jgi:hypothetical protein
MRKNEGKSWNDSRLFTLERSSSTGTFPLEEESLDVEDVDTSDVAAESSVGDKRTNAASLVMYDVGGATVLAPPRQGPALIAALVNAMVVPRFVARHVTNNKKSQPCSPKRQR